MSKLSRKELRKIILREIKKMEEDAIVYQANPGMLSRHDDPGRQIMYKSCGECGSKMYEGDKGVCEQCGYSMAEEETRKEYGSLNEGDCGGCGSCNPCSDKYEHGDYEVLDYDTDDDFIPDHMENLNNTNIMPDEAMSLGIKIGNHKTYKGSYMAKSHLYKVNKYSEKLYHMIPDGHNLEDWMRTKLAQIADDIGEVYHALDHDKFEGDV